MGRNVTSMPACSQILRVMFTFVVASTKPIGVVVVKLFGLGLLFEPLYGAQLPTIVLVQPVVKHTSIG